MLANYLIGLREGLEAALVVGILVAYVVKAGHRQRLGMVWAGTGVAVGLSLAFAGALTLTSHTLTEEAEHAFAGTLSVVAVALVTWMVFWMRRTARELRGELHGRLDRALAGGGIALGMVALVAVLREGLETALFLWAATVGSTAAASALLGALLGILTAVGIGWAVYRGAVRLNLATFFTWTGALLVVVAAGVLAYGVRDLQEAGWLPGGENIAFDVSGTIDENGPVGTLLGGFFHFDPVTTWLQLTVWAVYLVVTLAFYFRPHHPVPAEVAEQPEPSRA
ncbi:MAG: iron transporter [Frankiales bacterium]|nr:iron transporter [Frankiales bacterium]